MSEAAPIDWKAKFDACGEALEQLEVLYKRALEEAKITKHARPCVFPVGCGICDPIRETRQ